MSGCEDGKAERNLAFFKKLEEGQCDFRDSGKQYKTMLVGHTMDESEVFGPVEI